MSDDGLRVGYEIRAHAVDEFLARTGGPGRRQRVSAALRTGLAIMERHHKRVELRRGAGAAAGRAVADTLTSRTGELSRSYRIHYQRGALEGAYGSDLRRARVLEFGGTIRPTSGKALAIPTRRMRVGVGRDPRWPRDWPEGELFRPRGKRYLARRNAAGGIEVMYILVSSVTIPPRPTLGRTVAAKLEQVLKLIADANVGGEPDAAAG